MYTTHSLVDKVSTTSYLCVYCLHVPSEHLLTTEIILASMENLIN